MSLKPFMFRAAGASSVTVSQCKLSPLMVAVLLTACGGTHEVPRGDVAAPQIVSNAEDLGGRPAECDAEAGLEINWIETWESGAGTGWYTNNDQCEVCSTRQGDRADLKREIQCLVLQLDELGSSQDAGRVDDIIGEGYSCDQQELDKLLGFDPTWNDVGASSSDAGAGEADEANVEADNDKRQRLAEAMLKAKDQEMNEVILPALESCRAKCEPSQNPSFYAKPPPSEDILGGARCGSSRALHVRTIPLRGFGGNMGREFASSAPELVAGEEQKLAGFDGRDYDGLAFWARVGPNGRHNVRVTLATPYTTEKFLVEGGRVPCQFETTMDNAQETACDKFGVDLLLSNDWQFFKVPFADMRQAGFGVKAPGFFIDQILGLSLEYRAGSWDIWLDDVGFYRNKEQ